MAHDLGNEEFLMDALHKQREEIAVLNARLDAREVAIASFETVLHLTQEEITVLKAEITSLDVALAGEVAENARLRLALSAAQAVLNELQCYSTGVAVMAEEDIVELMGEYTEAVEKV